MEVAGKLASDAELSTQNHAATLRSLMVRAAPSISVALHWGYHLAVTTLLDKEGVCSTRAGSNNPLCTAAERMRAGSRRGFDTGLTLACTKGL